MNDETIPSRRSAFKTAIRAAGFITACLAMPIAAMALQPSLDAPTSAAKVSLTGLDLATSEGIAAARERLQETARQFCSQVGGNLDASRLADFLSCLDRTLIDELKQVSSGAQAAIVAHGSAWPTATEEGTAGEPREGVPDTRVMAISIADVDFKSAQGVDIAEKRIQKTARRICSQLIGSQDPASRYTKCVNDATAGALRQIHETAPAVS
jgi:UrcA family protein